MGYSAEVVRRARARLASAKEDRDSQNRQHLAIAYEQVPRIREIDRLLRHWFGMTRVLGTFLTRCHTSDIGHWFTMTHCTYRVPSTPAAAAAPSPAGEGRGCSPLALGTIGRLPHQCAHWFATTRV